MVPNTTNSESDKANGHCRQIVRIEVKPFSLQRFHPKHLSFDEVLLVPDQNQSIKIFRIFYNIVTLSLKL